MTTASEQKAPYAPVDYKHVITRENRVLLLELVCLLIAAPSLYFPNRFPVWAPFAATGLLLAGILLRHRVLNIWFVRTPADWPLWGWFLVLLPMSVAVAPAPLRDIYSIPRALILVWNFCLFALVVVHSQRSRSAREILAGIFVLAGTLIATAAIFGTTWVGKFPLLFDMLQKIPSPLVGMFEGAEAGFSPNQVAGSLLFVLPFVLGLLWAELSNLRRNYVLLPISFAGLLMSIVLVATQSRTGIVGLGVSLLIVVLAPFRWGRRALAIASCVLVLTLLLLPTPTVLSHLDGGTRFDGVSKGVNIAERYEIWQSAVAGIEDFSITGMGLGTFRHLAPMLYPFQTIPYTYDIAHAHNFFLQSALDFGVPGLVTVFAIYLIVITQGISFWRAAPFSGSRYWAIGLLAALIGQTIYSLADAVTMGAKTNFLAWYMFALIIGLGSIDARPHADDDNDPIVFASRD